MKKLLILLGILLVPFVAFGSNDVTLTTDTIVRVAGVDLGISGSSAVVDSITVNDNNFSFVMSSGSSIAVTSPDRKILLTDASGGVVTTTSCTLTNYTLTHTSSVAGPTTVTVTPSGDVCVPASTKSGSSSGRSGGGGGGGSVTPPVTVITPPKITVTGPTGFVFTRALGFGLQSEDVKMLQTRLLGEGFFKGEATGYFGRLTEAAVKAYQAKYGIDQLGIVGPATRAQLNKVVVANPGSNAAATSQLTSTQVSAIMSQINALLQQVQALQAKLKAQTQ